MTYGPRNILGVLRGEPVDALIFTGYATWPSWLRKFMDYVSRASQDDVNMSTCP